MGVVDRRKFLKSLSLYAPIYLTGCSVLRHYDVCSDCNPLSLFDPSKKPKESESQTPHDTAGAEDMGEVHSHEELSVQELSDELLKDAQAKSLYFSQDFPDDIFFHGEKYALVQAMAVKFRLVQRHVGYGNFNVIGMDEFFLLSERIPEIGGVSSKEKAFLEELFYFDAKKYGFLGDKVFISFTDSLKKRELEKVPYTGHFLRRGDSLEIYNKISKNVGESITLTSGVRALAKQFHLFLEKAIDTKGNMSKASRSLAPPGYSFHGQNDFDVGKKGFGLRNFTNDLAHTDEYKKLLDLGYIKIRYTKSNVLGVRFEPWHIKVES
ncbi:MAG: hypothetical protein CL676_13800 [Bdellovibrionaceae bacterium]|nr:hypothetical protein [Pseudobdellovibrionaceae bacterium]|tara:strand:- start:2460 stop:3428 length:969 start_codon:yes stop_codon:yes gene_type:complete